MGLQIKRAPAQLRADLTETVWPGDSAVDIEQSDLRKWCAEGGKAGLVFKPNERPDIIRWRALDEAAFGRIVGLVNEGGRNLPLAAFRHGCVSIEHMRLMRDRIDDADGLHDESMRQLGDVRMELPFYHALQSMQIAMGGDAASPELAEVRDDVMQTSLPQVLGCHIIAATFRNRRLDV